VGLYSFSIN